jgi:hypothetical protein
MAPLQQIAVDAIGRRDVFVPDLGGHVLLIGASFGRTRATAPASEERRSRRAGLVARVSHGRREQTQRQALDVGWASSELASGRSIAVGAPGTIKRPA